VIGAELRDAINGCRDSHEGLRATLAQLRDEDVRRPSRLPGWTVGHVLSHLASNADSVVRRLEGAARGEVVDQYPGGPSGRATEIDIGAARPAAELRADVLATSAAVEAAIAEMPHAAWSNLTRGVDGHESPADHVVFSRWREVEVHHVDLGLGYEPPQWPPALVDRWLATVIADLPDRTSRGALLAWALGRGPAPDLQSWG
jgi:maleylpyruvate isomerase